MATPHALPSPLSEEALMDRIVSIWRREFVVETIGPDDDFFELGGDSLLALELIGQIEEELGITVPTSSFLSATTPRTLAASVASSVRSEAEPPPPYLLPLSQNPRDSPRNTEAHGRGPLVCFHAIDGGAMFYRDWAARLASFGLEVFGVESPLSHGLDLTAESLEDLAADYLDLIEQSFKGVQLALCGYSFGALVAYEVARQAERRGIPVAGLVIVDMFNPGAVRIRGAPERLLSVWRRHAGEPVARRLQAVATKVASLANALASTTRGGLAERLPSASAALKRRGRARARHFQMIRRYRPGPTRARTLLVMNREPWDKFGYADDWRGWRSCLLGEVETGTLEGTHLQVFEPENQRTLASMIERFFQGGAASSSSPSGG